MKKLSLLFIVVILIGNLTSCGGRKYDEQLVRAEAEKLIAASEPLNTLIWGVGLEASDSDETRIGIYNRALAYSLDEYGVKTVEDIKAKIRSTFSSSYAESIINNTFSSVNDGVEIKLYARYYQKYTDDEAKLAECVMVNKNYNYFLKDTVVYLYDTIEVTHSKKETVYVNIGCTVTTSDGKVQNQTITVGLIEEPEGWRLDSPTYTVYNDGSYKG